MQETPVWFLDWEDPLEKREAIHASVLAWRIPWTGWSMGTTYLLTVLPDLNIIDCLIQTLVPTQKERERNRREERGRTWEREGKRDGEGERSNEERKEERADWKQEKFIPSQLWSPKVRAKCQQDCASSEGADEDYFPWLFQLLVSPNVLDLWLCCSNLCLWVTLPPPLLSVPFVSFIE